jgi:hypothetical protein
MTTWFHSKDLSSTIDLPTVVVDDIYGYVLPHAGTQYTGDIIQHTLQFCPKNIHEIRRVYIYYFPANSQPDITIPEPETNANTVDTETLDNRVILSSISTSECDHELYVPFRTILHYFRKWNVNTKGIKFIPVNVRNIQNKWMNNEGAGGRSKSRRRRDKLHHRKKTRRRRRHVNGSFYIISADFSHHKPFNYAIPNENKAAHAIVTDSLECAYDTPPYLNEIDDVRTFRVFKTKHSNLSFQWIGRTRSLGENAVGYHSFLIRPEFHPMKSDSRPIDGIFVTCYDSKMNARECLGEWFSTVEGHTWTPHIEKAFIKKVKSKAQTESRLTGGENKNIPITRCIVTYLFKDASTTSLIRGWHGVRTNAIYLPDVLLENAKEDGVWITPKDNEWSLSEKSRDPTRVFDMTETLEQLDQKAGNAGLNTEITLYTTRIRVKK